MNLVIKIAVGVFLGIAASVGAAPANAAHARTWSNCSKSAGDRAARSAGLAAALNADAVLHRVFSGTKASRIYRRPSRSLCADVNGDGRLERALLYQCCTVSSPAPWVVLRRTAGHWRIAYRRLHDTTWKLEADGQQLVTTEPKYGPDDAHCCPVRLRLATLRWTGRRFKRTFRVVRSDTEGLVLGSEAPAVPQPAPEPPGGYVEDCRATVEAPCPVSGSG